ncbi:hypothetical protein P152DRAFT_71291 [Eremomyces bilateralis CBS 781.70]|uniref:BTB domain-containing protein n=1 Tax=Eremomyces bilateralis CBS 781.70 TaxID=1392243 RepID=A0A6G1G0N8_9PEZI|nr:uncharacterized protein P152DRAFT_71291 [Eremomyces bilateralis CBS 781.70]KAF1811379.1 hypothetical protein P152DRAFT_71291 [Eremomyces bilateralis CBS 781.70]
MMFSVTKSHRKGESFSTRHRSTQETPVQASPPLTSAIVTLYIGHEQRTFAAHEDVLCHSPYFAAMLREQYFEPSNRRIELPDEEPEVFSCILEYLYKGDYTPRMEYDKRRRSWQLENSSADPTVWLTGVCVPILRDTVVYCAATRYGLEDLTRVALRKQGLQTGIQCSTILSSARYAYANTPETDSKLRAHYLTLIIRSRQTFKRSGTMQNEMEAGGRLFFDLFVAMVNHMDEMKSPR